MDTPESMSASFRTERAERADRHYLTAEELNAIELSEAAFEKVGVKVDRLVIAGHFEQFWLSRIMQPRLKAFVQGVLEKYLPDRFFIMPPSTTGKHHPKKLHRAGGLVLHTWRALHMFAALREGCQVDMHMANWFYAGLVLHDGWKAGKGWGEAVKSKAGKGWGERHGAWHAVVGATEVLKIGLFGMRLLPPKDVQFLAELVLRHLGPYGIGATSEASPTEVLQGTVRVSAVTVEPKAYAEWSALENLFYICDLLAANKYTFTGYDDFIVDWLYTEKSAASEVDAMVKT